MWTFKVSYIHIHISYIMKMFMYVSLCKVIACVRAGINLIMFIYLSKKTSSISYKILPMRVLYTNPCRGAIITSYVDAH